ncbi:lipopolysaccharide transport periplasmic protein LptA [Pseudoruegeria sp. SK021]|uniref:lipopolysaccharide transport periplasmic protein LptA n=1 Tax=Pseudoruegeria sp. SK021 TaxID=1933035 RepID=UPI000A24560B|nr:lipopolysaccharide transport periplasmic protein LptA [Pseudoruegeria sp. SK021]OSP54690.1 lipopolysaccharide transport periplasmic protein LptA [Pseudoruegeria sp. SK021]
MKRLSGPVFALALLGMAVSASAQQTGVALGGFKSDPDAPVEVAADKLDLAQSEGTAIFSGNVVVTQGEMKLTAQQIVVTYLTLPDGSLGTDVDTIAATGDVVMVTPSEAAEADKAVYTPARNEVVMSGNVLLTQGVNTLAGERLIVDLVTGTGQVDGRVRTLLQTGGTE